MAVNQVEIKGGLTDFPISNQKMPAKDHCLEVLVNNVNNNKFSIYYSKDNSLFKEKIDKLNLNFYLESERYLSNKTSRGKCQDSLFLILFQQIGIYIEEIERLNALLLSKKDNPDYIKERIEENINKQKEFETKELLIQTLKESNKKLEAHLCTLITNEDKLKLEIERLKLEIIFYQDKLKLFMLIKENDNNGKEKDSNKEAVLNMDLNSISSNKLIEGQNGGDNQSVLHIKQSFVRKRNNSDQNNGINPQTRKKSKIIRGIKEKAEFKRNATRWNSPLIGNHEDTRRDYDHQSGNIIKMERLSKETKKGITQTKQDDEQKIQMDYLESQDYSKNNIKTEVISDIDDYEGSNWKNNNISTVHRREIRTIKLPIKNKRFGLINSIAINLNNECKAKNDGDNLSYSNAKSKAKKTQCKIITNVNGAIKKSSSKY